MSLSQQPPNPMRRFRCQALHADERGFLTSMAQAIEAYALRLPNPPQGLGVADTFNNLLVGTAPSPDAYVIIRGRSRWGGFGVRMDLGGYALQVTAYRTESDGCRHDLGSLGTVLQCRGSRIFYRDPVAYPEVLQLITETAATPGGIYVCTGSRGCPKVSGLI